MLNFITWNVNPELFHLGPISVRWYGLMFVIGFWIGYNIMYHMFRHEGAPESWLEKLFIYVVLATIIGARLGHVIFYQPEYYFAHPLDILKIWEGGLASHGGAIGIIIAIALFSKYVTHRSMIWTFDRLVVPVALVGALIRMGNLMNSEIFGHETTLPWGFMFVRSNEWNVMYQGLACHPTQIYEALAYLALFALLMWMYWKKNAEERPGLIFGIFLTWLFSARFLIEFVKNVQVDFEQGMILDMGQWLSVPFIIVGVILIIMSCIRPRLNMTFPNQFPKENLRK